MDSCFFTNVVYPSVSLDAKPGHPADDADRDGQSRPSRGRQEDKPYCQLSPTNNDSGEFGENIYFQGVWIKAEGSTCLEVDLRFLSEKERKTNICSLSGGDPLPFFFHRRG